MLFSIFECEDNTDPTVEDAHPQGIQPLASKTCVDAMQSAVQSDSEFHQIFQSALLKFCFGSFNDNLDPSYLNGYLSMAPAEFFNQFENPFEGSAVTELQLWFKSMFKDSLAPLPDPAPSSPYQTIVPESLDALIPFELDPHTHLNQKNVLIKSINSAFSSAFISLLYGDGGSESMNHIYHFCLIPYSTSLQQLLPGIIASPYHYLNPVIAPYFSEEEQTQLTRDPDDFVSSHGFDVEALRKRVPNPVLVRALLFYIKAYGYHLVATSGIDSNSNLTDVQDTHGLHDTDYDSVFKYAGEDFEKLEEAYRKLLVLEAHDTGYQREFTLSSGFSTVKPDSDSSQQALHSQVSLLFEQKLLS